MKKRILSLFLAVCMVLSVMCTTALSADVPTDAGNGMIQAIADPGQDEDESVLYSDKEWELLKLVNKERIAGGLEPLAVFSGLQRAAAVREQELIPRYSHTRPGGESGLSALTEAGIDYRTAAENISAGQSTPRSALQALLNNDTYRANILNSDFVHMGMGYTNQTCTIITGTGTGRIRNGWVQLLMDDDCTITDISLSRQAVSCMVGSTLDMLNLYVEAVCSVHGICYLPLVGEMCTGFDAQKIGEQTVYVAYCGQVEQLQVTVFAEGAPEPDPEPETIYEVVVGEVYNGTVTTDRVTAAAGAQIAVTATPAAGYVLKEILVNGKVIAGASFSMPAQDVTITAVFEKEEPELPAGTIIDTGRSLSLSGEVFINQYIEVQGFEGVDIAAKGGLLVWNSAVSEEAALFGTADITQAGLVAYGSEYTQRTLGIPARRYADEVYLRVYIEVADDEYVYGPLTQYSVQEYCEHKINSVEYEDKLKQTCAALLHFGTAAQTYFDYNADDPANANILDRYSPMEWDADLLTTLDPIPDTNITNTVDVSDNGQSVSLTGATRVNFYFGFSGDVSKAELLVWDGVSGALSEENVSYTQELIYYSDEYTGQSRDFAAREYGKTIFACAKITDGAGTVHYSDVIAFSPEAYAAGKLNYSDAKLVELVKRMVVYGETARVYFER